MVVVLAGGSWVLTGGLGGKVAPQPQSRPGLTPGPTSPICASAQLQLSGALNDCAGINRTSPPSCDVAGISLDSVFELSGAASGYLMYLTIHTYSGAGRYELNNGAAEVDITQDTTGASWKSAAGVLTMAGNDGRSGRVSATLVSVGSNVAVRPLRVEGPWSCG